MVISLTSKDPQACKGVVRFDYTKGEYVPVKLTEWMIDHLEVESAVIHKESEEAQIQLQREGANKLGKRRKGWDHIIIYLVIPLIHIC